MSAENSQDWRTSYSAADQAWQQAKYADAERLYGAVVEQLVAAGNENDELLIACKRLAALRARAGEGLQAISLLNKALSAEKHIYGEQNPRVGRTFLVLGSVYRDLGDEQQAAKNFELALKALENEADELLIADTLEELSKIHVNQSRYQEAEQACKRALEIKSKLLGANGIELVIPLKILTDLLTREGRSAEAEPLQKQIKDIVQTQVR